MLDEHPAPCPSMKLLIPIRLYLIAETLRGVVIACLSANDPAYALLRVGGSLAPISACIITALAALALVDLFLSETCSRLWTRIKRRRWMIWLAMGGGYILQSAVAVNYGFTPGVASAYLLGAIGCASVAWLDIKYRYKEAKEHLRASGCSDLDSKPMVRAWDV